MQELLIAKDVLPCERKRYRALWHSHLGYSAKQIAELGIMSPDPVRRTIHLYKQGGLDALLERVHLGRDSKITPEIAEDLKQLVAKNDQTWNTRTLAEHLEKEHGVSLKRSAIGVQLKHLGISWQRTRHTVAGEADPKEKAHFKKNLEIVKRGP